MIGSGMWNENFAKPVTGGGLAATRHRRPSRRARFLVTNHAGQYRRRKLTATAKITEPNNASKQNGDSLRP